MPQVQAGGTVSISKQKPLKPPQTLSPVLELHSVISARSLQDLGASSGEEEEKRTVSRLNRERTSLSGPRARTPLPILHPSARLDVQHIGEDTTLCTDRSSTPSHASGQKLAECKFFCATRPAFSIEISKSGVRSAVSPALRHATRKVENMRGLYV